MFKNKFFRAGFASMLPISAGIVPFAAVMGSVFAGAKLTLLNSMLMNVLVYAGAAQLAAVDLMTKNAAVVVVVLSGLVINLRFLLYSAAMSPRLRKANTLTKFICSYTLADQAYTAMLAHEESFKTDADAIIFYFGSAFCMVFMWHGSVLAGYFFGDFAPSSWSLDYAVPLSFVALVLPTLKNKKYVAVAAFSSILSLLLYPLPFKSSLIVTALLSVGFAALLTKKKRRVA